ncbi:O-antigen ligase family protein [Flavivirga sp. 57AJ16]|uniref:O-antigen ligase family protein n=1 Tax=Flavivirga sp. 57AJ16 TaxID=3025307 RepID=UPI0023658A27|nr:O-antigen ligase family protein [Flavivirga sp. 57AJ16]MDD7885918.1 O-antigen ligase family protein [Flavivirga sp. 57AJ16]
MNVWVNIGLLTFPFVLPLPLPLNVKSIAFILFLITLSFNISKQNFKIKEIITNKIVVLFVIFYLLDPVFSIIRGNGFYLRDLRISFLLAPLLFLISKDLLKRFKNKILNVFVLGVFGYILFTVVYVIYFYTTSKNHEFAIDYYLKYVTYHHLPFAIHHTYLGMYICFAASIIMFNKKLKHNLKAFLCIFLFLSTFIIASKLSIVFFILILFIYLFKTFKVSFLKLTISITAFTAVLIFIFYFLLLKTDIFRTLQNSISDRISLIYCSLEGIYSNFLLGIGNKNIKGFIEQCDSNLGLLDTHNLFLQEFLSNGFFGGAILTIILYIFTKTFFKAKSILGIILIVAVIFFGLIEHVLSLQYGMLYIVFFSLLFHSTVDLNSKFYDK